MPFQNRRPSLFQQALNRVALRLAELEIVTNVAAGDCQEVTPCDGEAIPYPCPQFMRG